MPNMDIFEFSRLVSGGDQALVHYFQVGMLTGTRVPGTRIYYPNPGS